ncbi:MAG TPA: hypothetical protein VGO11_14435 [Chthoniobacteraceae bacterium]|jgi:hypothetical protein|nr:hypothetical protein [Chthoniobacteraceae bacterium]
MNSDKQELKRTPTWCVVVMSCMGLALGFLILLPSYVLIDLKDFQFLSSDATIPEITAKWGPPGEIIEKGQAFPERGWPNPRSKADARAYVYVRKTGTRFVIFSRDDHEVSYVFSSSS